MSEHILESGGPIPMFLLVPRGTRLTLKSKVASMIVVKRSMQMTHWTGTVD